MTKSSWNKLPLKSLFRLDTTSCLPASQSEQAFLHHSIPAWDESGGPIVELGNTIGSNKFLISHACVLVSKLNPRKSRVSVVRDLHGEFPQCSSTEFMVYVPIHEDADIGFYSWYMKSECFQSELEKVATGTTNSHVRVTPKETLNWKIAHPPLPEQRRIAEILDTIDEAIQKTEVLRSKLKAMKQGLLHDLLTCGLDKNGKLRDPKAHPEQFKNSLLGSTPRFWRVQKLQSFYDEPSVNGLYKPKKYYGHGPLMIHMPQMFRGLIIDTSDAARVEVNFAEIDRYGLRNGDLVFARRSLNLEGAGRCALVNDLTETTTFESSIIRVRIRQEELLPEFVNYFLNSAIGFKLRLPLIRQVAVSGVSSGDIASIPIPCPSISEQERIIKVIEAHVSRIRNEEQYSDKLKLQKKGLMHDLLTGKVRVKV